MQVYHRTCQKGLIAIYIMCDLKLFIYFLLLFIIVVEFSEMQRHYTTVACSDKSCF